MKIPTPVFYRKRGIIMAIYHCSVKVVKRSEGGLLWLLLRIAQELR